MKSVFLVIFCLFSSLTLLAQSPDANRSNISDSCYCQPSDTVNQKDAAEYEALSSMHARLAKEYSKMAKELAERSRWFKARADRWEKNAKICMTDANTYLNNDPASAYGPNSVNSRAVQLQKQADDSERSAQSSLQEANRLRKESEAFATKAEEEIKISEYYKKIASLIR